MHKSSWYRAVMCQCITGLQQLCAKNPAPCIPTCYNLRQVLCWVDHNTQLHLKHLHSQPAGSCYSLIATCYYCSTCDSPSLSSCCCSLLAITACMLFHTTEAQSSLTSLEAAAVLVTESAAAVQDKLCNNSPLQEHSNTLLGIYVHTCQEHTVRHVAAGCSGLIHAH